MAREYPRNLPDTYAREKLTAMRAWWSGELGRYLRDYWPRVFAGMPVAACLGFCSNASLTENTGHAAAHAAFAEIGVFGVPAGPWNEEPTNSNTSAQNDWYRLASDPNVRALLGRSACIGPGCWLPANGGTADQAAVGVVMLAGDYESGKSALVESLKPMEPSEWAAAVAFWSWSAGGRGMALTLNPFEEAIRALGNVSEREKFLAVGFVLAVAAQAGHNPGEVNRYSRPAYGWIRTAQKLRAGELIAAEIGGSEWFEGPSPLRAWVDEVLALASVSADTSRAGAPPAHAWTSGGSDAWTWGLGLGLAGLLGLLIRAMRRR